MTLKVILLFRSSFSIKYIIELAISSVFTSVNESWIFDITILTNVSVPTIDIVSLKELIAFDIIVGSSDFVINFVKIGITDLIISWEDIFVNSNGINSAAKFCNLISFDNIDSRNIGNNTWKCFPF